MKLGLWLSAALATVGVGAYLIIGKVYPPDRPATTDLGAGDLETSRDRASAVPLRPEPVVVAGESAARLVGDNLRKRFTEASDYLELAEELLPKASAGDSASQYYLARVLDYCEENSRMFLRRAGRSLSPSEVQEWALKRQLPVEIAESVDKRCRVLQGRFQDFGSAGSWLVKASDGGYAPAQAEVAMRLLEQQAAESRARARGEKELSSDQLQSQRSPRDLLREAVTSKSPEVLFAIGEAQAMLDPANTNVNDTRFAWWLVACERGLDCSYRADWVKVMCANDPTCMSATSPGDLVMTLSGDRWPMVQQRATEISGALDAGQWNSLGLEQS